MDGVKYKYGTFDRSQIAKQKDKLRKQIFFLLLIADPETADNYEVDVEAAFKNIQNILDESKKCDNHPFEYENIKY